jgi:2-octaprenyl-6-methoxyphenol hydroxylase
MAISGSGKERRTEKPIAVVGTGLAGLSTALGLAALGVATMLIGPRIGRAQASRDTRSTALFGPSVDFVRRLGIMEALEPPPVPLRGLRLVDATGGLFRAPEVLFQASEVGADAFGMNFENGPLLMALADEAAGMPVIEWIDATALSIEAGESVVRIDMSNGESLSASLVIGADGERSLCRKGAGIRERSWIYPQVAIAARFSHRRPHDGISTELHRRAGPLTTVPLAGHASSLVWVERPERAEVLLALDDRAFAQELQSALASALGDVLAVGPRASFPLSGVTAEVLGARRVALVGEAAHRLPPIGAQGLNLGLRDAAWLADLVADAVADGADPGAPHVLRAYDAARRTDVLSRTAVVDTLNRSLIADWLPADLARSAGLAALKTIGPLRRLFMREGMGPGGRLPRLMQPVERSVSVSEA